MATKMLLAFFLYTLITITVCDVFKLVNSSVQLDIQKKIEKFFHITWSFNIENNIVLYNGKSPSTVIEVYEDRVEFNETTHSLTLKNLQKNDSGLYKADAVGAKTETIATYELHVLDPVETPVLSYQKHNDTCNVTVTCEAQNLSLTSHCYNNNCDKNEEEISGHPFLFLSLHVSNSFIICNHSNPVSWKHTAVEVKHVKQLCSPEGGDSKIDETNKTHIITLGLGIGIVGFLCVGFILFCCKRRKTANNRKTKTDSKADVNTVYEEVETMNKGGKNPQSVEMSVKDEPSSTVYCTVGKPGQACIDVHESTVSNANTDKEMDPNEVSPNNKPYYTHQNQGADKTPQTIYATVNKAGKPE